MAKFINVNGTLVNTKYVCIMRRYYETTKEPGSSEKKDYFRIFIVFSNGDKDHIKFDTAKDMDDLFNSLVTPN